MSSSRRYRRIRQAMRTGDLLLWRSETLLGALIRFFSHGNVNHASLVIRFKEYESGLPGRRFCLEALAGGIELRLVSRRLANFAGRCWWYPLRAKYDSRRPHMAALALGYVGVPYDYESLFANISGRVLADSRRFFCSEYVYQCGIEAGLPDWESGRTPRPADMPQLNWWSDPVEITPPPA